MFWITLVVVAGFILISLSLLIKAFVSYNHGDEQAASDNLKQAGISFAGMFVYLFLFYILLPQFTYIGG